MITEHAIETRAQRLLEAAYTEAAAREKQGEDELLFVAAWLAGHLAEKQLRDEARKTTEEAEEDHRHA